MNVRLNGSGLGTGLELALLVGGLGAGRGAERREEFCSEKSLSLCTSAARATRISDTVTLACLRLALTPRVWLPPGLELGEYMGEVDLEDEE